MKLIYSDEVEDKLGIIESLVETFITRFDPVESKSFHILQDKRTDAVFAECHVLASKLVELGTDDVALDPDGSPDLRANRLLVDDHAAFQQMKSDAAQKRSFSNLVCEFVDDPNFPLQVIGGQHRFRAIKDALEEQVDALHGVKVYFGLDKEQRLDVQVISNTNISVSKDLLDRMYETVAGSELREWCQKVGLLGKKEDFADKRKRGAPLTVNSARNFIVNFYAGMQIDPDNFDHVVTTPLTTRAGVRNPKDWEFTKKENPDWQSDKALQKAGEEFAKLRIAQEAAFIDSKTGKPTSGSADYRDKANNAAVLAGWAFVAGILQKNSTRLNRHYILRQTKTNDPLRAQLLAKGKHSTDADSYRGLGYRTDPQERGRFVELFWLHAEKGPGISGKLISAAIEAFHAKQASIKAKKLKEGL